ncbi:glycosyltransferase family 39 protein [Leptolyngbya sp. Heron Island J]|uniref:glycosyltransferase family 39 protein n=1 Tax=Leptolyngbya sp. Heron Island J TaxID=1385935 RepID=UPI001376CEB6|nr:glycosyltransferase family 39 protein [Leptolyngbya sp. Heron Island J]
MPWQQILYEGFEPSNITGFNVSRLGHLAIIKCIAALFGPGIALINAVAAVYLIFLMALAVAGYFILRLLMPNAKGLGRATIISLFAPMTVFLAFKTCPDLPALLFSGLSCLFLLLSLERRSWFKWFLLSAIFLALTGLTKHVHAWMYISLSGTLLLFGRYRCSFRQALFRVTAIGMTALLIFGITLFVLRIPISQFLGFMVVASKVNEPILAKLLKLVLTYGLFLLVLPLAWLNPNRKWKWFMIAWFGLATVPFLIILSRLEVRYLTLSAVPLSGLVWLALDSLNSWANYFPNRSRQLMWTVAMVSAVIVAILVQPLTEHELRIDQFASTIQTIQADAEEQEFSVLIPWEYADFHYLRVAYPDLNVFSVHENSDLSPEKLADWKHFQNKYYGERVLHTLDDINALPGLKYYVGYGATFSIENLRQMLEYLPASDLRQEISAKVQSMSPLRHMEKSWMWNHPSVELQVFRRVGHYQIFRVDLLPYS